LYLAIATILIRKFLRTRDAGFVWPGVAVVVWPLVSRLLEQGERVLIGHVARGEMTGVYPFSLIERGELTLGSLAACLTLLQQLAGVSLLLVAVLCLSRHEMRLQAPR